MKLLLIYNPHAGHDRAKKLYPQVEQALNQQRIEFETRFTQYPQHATEIIAGLNFDMYNGIIAAGGDGTLFEVINGYFQNKTHKRIPIGVLPVGTGNAFARDLNLDSKNWQEAVEIIALNKPRKVDVGTFHSNGKDYYFMNILGLGFVADVTQTAYHLKGMGNVSYTLGVLYQTIFLKTHKLTIEMDGITLERENIFVEISNTRYTSNFLMAPNAKFDDGLFDITLLGKLNRRGLIKKLPTVFTGEHVHLEEVETFTAKQIHVHTDIPKVLTPDGEVLGSTPIHVKCLYQAVEIFGR